MWLRYNNHKTPLFSLKFLLNLSEFPTKKHNRYGYVYEKDNIQKKNPPSPKRAGAGLICLTK